MGSGNEGLGHISVEYLENMSTPDASPFWVCGLGTEDSFGELRSTLGQFFIRRGIVGDDVEDLIQESLLVLWTKRDTVRADGARLFLFGIAGRLLLAHRRHRWEAEQREEKFEQEAMVLSARLSAGLDTEDEDLNRVWESLEDLPKRLKETIRLIYIEGCSRAEVACRLGLAEESVRKNEWRAVVQIRARVKKRSRQVGT